MNFNYRKKIPKQKEKFDIMDISLQDLKNMEAQDVLESFRMVIYSKDDVSQINKGLKIIRQVLNKNSKKLTEGN